MPIEVTMPRLSDTMERGTIVHWNVKEGDAVSPGQPLGDIETDKATMELQSFDSGTVASVLLSEGDSVEVGTLMLVLAEKGEDPAEVKASYSKSGGASAGGERSAPKKQAGAQRGDDAGDEAEGGRAPVAVADRPGGGAGAGKNGRSGAQSDDAPGRGGRVFASPLARKIAEEKGIDLSEVRGTGPGGRITRKDVEEGGSAEKRAPAQRAAGGRDPSALAAGQVSQPASPAPLPALGPGLERRSAPLSNMRRTIARRLVESKQSIPHYQVTVAVNADPLLALRAQLNEQLASHGVRLSVNDFLVRACALAMHRHPFVNSSWGGDGAAIEMHDRVNIGVAVSLPEERGGGLVVAVVRDADRIGLRQISSETRTLAEKARTRGLSIEEMEGSTFTISNLGMYGVEHFTAIINPPNSAILAVGAAVQKPVVRGGAVVVGHEMQMTMSSDHRVIDGAMAAAYLGTVREMLESPATLLV